MIFRAFLKFIFVLITIAVIALNAIFLIPLDFLNTVRDPILNIYSDLILPLIEKLPFLDTITNLSNTVFAFADAGIRVMLFTLDCVYLVLLVLALIFFCLVWKKRKKVRAKDSAGVATAALAPQRPISQLNTEPNDLLNRDPILDDTTEILSESLTRKYPNVPLHKLEGYIETDIYKIDREGDIFRVCSSDRTRILKSFDNPTDAFDFASRLDRVAHEKYPNLKSPKKVKI